MPSSTVHQADGCDVFDSSWSQRHKITSPYGTLKEKRHYMVCNRMSRMAVAMLQDLFASFTSQMYMNIESDCARAGEASEMRIALDAVLAILQLRSVVLLRSRLEKSGKPVLLSDYELVQEMDERWDQIRCAAHSQNQTACLRSAPLNLTAVPQGRGRESVQ
eukprot:1282869-Rhodomonas_salina.2